MMSGQEKRQPPSDDKQVQVDEADLDEALDETFPASDPPSVTHGTTGIPDSVKKEHDKESEPKR
jgi:hypothetical protein